jgi:NAD(P)H-hydrate epimerase
VDVPSGIHSDSGEADRLTLSADLTVTFHAPKRAHFLFPAAKKCGELVVADIGIETKYTEDLQIDVATPCQISDWLPKRPLDGHKGTFGSVLVAGGSRNYLGAPVLSGKAAYRVGAGLVALVVPQALRQLGATHLPEATFPFLPDEDALGRKSAENLSPEKYTALLIGPGLGDQSDAFIERLLASPNLPPLICDADALNYLSRQNNWWNLLPPQTILTPHPGEMSRLVGHDIREEDRFDLAQKYAQKWGHVVVLKGAFTLIASPSGLVTTIPIATPLLATAGSGDVLAGAIAGLLAQRVEPSRAAVVGAYLHAAAGFAQRHNYGNSGLLAHEIADQLPSIRANLSPPP